MVAIFVAGAELEMAIEEKAQVVLEAREDEMLVARVAGKNNFVGIDIVFRAGSDLLRLRDSRAQCTNDEKGGYPQAACGAQLIREQEGTPEGDSSVD